MFIKRDLEENDWNELIKSIRRERCILILGPGAILDKTETPLYEKLCKNLAKEVKAEFSGRPEDLFSFMETLRKRERWLNLRADLLEQVYKDSVPHSIYEKLAFIPFSLVISTSPSKFIYQAFQENGIESQFAYYNYRKNQSDQDDLLPQKNNPLIYNLFGSIQDENSLIFTHDDMFEFLFSLLGTRKLPLGIQEEVANAFNFLFLGFDFENWYLKILLRLLQSHKKEISYAQPWNTEQLQNETITFYQQNFKVSFIGSDISKFLDKLYRKCLGANMLRLSTKQKGKPNIAEQVKKIMKSGETEKALDILDDYLIAKKDSDLLHQITLLHGRLSRLKKSKQKGTISTSEAELELNKISEAILEILLELASDMDSNSQQQSKAG